MSRKPRYCPKCLGQQIRKIVYGMPASETIDKANAGKIALGGCCFSDESPKWHCATCKYEFGKAIPNPEDLLNWEPDGIKPLKLELYIGGFDLPGQYCVKLEGDVVKYGIAREGSRWLEIILEVTPSHRKWINFRKKLDHIGVWKWKRSYHNPCVCDGVQWKFEVDYGILKKKTYGSNLYPGSKGFDMDETPEFKMFLQALNRLFGSVKLIGL